MMYGSWAAVAGIRRRQERRWDIKPDMAERESKNGQTVYRLLEGNSGWQKGFAPSTTASPEASLVTRLRKLREIQKKNKIMEELGRETRKHR